MKRIKRNEVPTNELVMYHNEFHKINISKLSVLENNLLFDIFKRLSYNDDIVFNMVDLNKMVYSNNRVAMPSETQKIVEGLYKNFFSLNFKIIYPGVVEYIHMFSKMGLVYEDKTNKKLESLTIRVNPDFKYLLHDIKKQFTAFNLIEFKKLNSKYSKTLFRLITQYSSIGKLKMKWDEFIELLGIPTNYEFKTISVRVLKPSIQELSQFIKNLEYKVEKERIEGKLVHSSITFTFNKFQNNGSYINRIKKKVENCSRVMATVQYNSIISEEANRILDTQDKEMGRISKC